MLLNQTSTMNKYLRYTLLIVVFVISWYIQLAIAIFSQFEMTGRMSGGIVGIGGFIALFLSYGLCKYINNKIK